MAEQERWAIHVDGIAIPGYTEDEARKELDDKPELRSKGAIATRLYGSPPKVRTDMPGRSITAI